MKKLLTLFTIFLFAFFSCKTERSIQWPVNSDELMEGITYGGPNQALNQECRLSSSFILEPDWEYGYCLLPERARIPIFNRFQINGEIPDFGILDPNFSYQYQEECQIIPESGIVSMRVTGALVNRLGDSIFYYGDAICFEDGRYEGNFFISGGNRHFLRMPAAG